MATTPTAIDIPADFGSGGKGLTPNGGASPTLKDILVELQTVADAAAAAADAAQATANSGSASAALGLKQEAVWLKTADDSLAGDTVPEAVFHRASKAERVSALALVLSAGITADATDKVIVTVWKRTAALPGTAVSVGVYTSDLAGGSCVAWTAKLLTRSVVAGAIDLVAGDCLTVTITKGGAGKVVPAGMLSAALALS